MNTLNTTNPNCFTYTTEELLIELLGGIRIDTLDRMRVTIKVSVTKRKHPGYTGELADLAVRHNLDLYNDTLLEKFVRTVAERLEVGTIAIKKASRIFYVGYVGRLCGFAIRNLRIEDE